MQDREWEIDVCRLLGSLRRSALCILALAVEGALAAFLGTLLLTNPQYRSTVMFHGRSNVPTGSYRVVLMSQETLETVLTFSGVGRTYEEVGDMIRFSLLDPAEFFEVTVTSPDPREAELLADAVAAVLPVRIGDVLEGTSAEPVNDIIGAAEQVDPGSGRNAILGAAAGLLFGLGVACVDGVTDTVIRTEKDLKKGCQYPILVVMSKDYRKGSKLLRAKLAHLLVEEPRAHILGITSALPGEGAAKAAEHLVLSLKKQGKRVILVDCDLGTGKEDSRAKPLGLADYLTGRGELGQIIRHNTLEKEQFVAIPGGYAGENSAELLSSREMEELLQKFRGGYDYVILILPAMAEAGTVLPLAENLDGILMCVQRDMCNAEALNYAVEQLEFVNANILGLIYQDFVPAAKTKHRLIKELTAAVQMVFRVNKAEGQIRQTL